MHMETRFANRKFQLTKDKNYVNIFKSVVYIKEEVRFFIEKI